MDDWKVGDLALCVSLGPDPTDWEAEAGGPRKGEVHTVAGVDGAWLSFEPWPGFDFYYLAFRKISPPEADEFDREVIDLMTKQPAEVR